MSNNSTTALYGTTGDTTTANVTDATAVFETSYSVMGNNSHDVPNETTTDVTTVNVTHAVETFRTNYEVSDVEKICQMSFCGVGFVGNFLVLFVFLKTPDLRRKMSNMLIMNQSMIDMTLCMFMILSKVFDSMDWPWITEPGPLVELYCRVWLSEWLSWSCEVISTFNLVALTIDRYIALMHPLFYKTYISRKHLWAAMVLVWVIGLTYESYYVVTSELKGRLCTLWTEWPSDKFQTVFGICIFFIEYFFPMCILVFCYTRLVIMIRSKAKMQVGSSNRDKQMRGSQVMLIRTLILVALGFFLCWTWAWVYTVMYHIGVVDTFSGLQYQIGAMAIFVNATVNPFIYSFSHTIFRKALVNIFTCRHRDDKN